MGWFDEKTANLRVTDAENGLMFCFAFDCGDYYWMHYYRMGDYNYFREAIVIKLG
jgi:hypothetical protein